ncbi:MAG: hypothetical protein MUO60_04160 [Clostridiaceae bacterium]|nr:hypothetical protein [Clostridiaceae bacterium]
MVDNPKRTYESPGNFIIFSSLKNVWIKGESIRTGIVIIMETIKRFLKSATYAGGDYVLGGA